MRFRRSLAIARHDALVLRGDPFPIVVLLLIPLAVMAFLKPASRLVLTAQGIPGTNGAEHAVPGMTVMFAFFVVSTVAFAFFRDHGWRTWERVRASRATPTEILVGKVVPVLVLAVVQQVVLLTLGGLIYGIHVRGSVVALAMVVCALALCLVTLGLMLSAYCNTQQQVNSVAQVGAIVFGGLAGALSPFALLPGWARAIAPATPTYWAMRGFRSVILDAEGMRGVILPTSVLLSFATVFAILAVRRFRLEENKVGFA
ncbi:MAG: ABC transporter permease [Actinomycetota bacterium]